MIKPKELRALAKVCRETGITTLEAEGIKFTLGAAPYKAPKKFKEKVYGSDFERLQAEMKAAQEAPVKAKAEMIKSDTPTEDELLFWSSGDGSPESEETA